MSLWSPFHCRTALRVIDVSQSERMRSTIPQHLDILANIQTGDAEAARRALTEGVIHGRCNVQAVISEALVRAQEA